MVSLHVGLQQQCQRHQSLMSAVVAMLSDAVQYRHLYEAISYTGCWVTQLGYRHLCQAVPNPQGGGGSWSAVAQLASCLGRSRATQTVSTVSTG